MAIKVGGTTVVDDSRNLCNVGNVCATTYYGSAAGLTNVPASDNYFCAIACSAILAGDAVAGGVGTCGVGLITGIPASIVTETYCCTGTVFSPANNCCTKVCDAGDIAIVKFGSSECCFASLVWRGGTCRLADGCCNAVEMTCSCFTLRAHEILANGIITTSLLCTAMVTNAAAMVCGSSQNLTKKILPITRSGGRKSSFLATSLCSTPGSSVCMKQEFNLCLCDTSNVITVTCICCANGLNQSRCQTYEFITPDRRYLMSLMGCFGGGYSCGSPVECAACICSFFGVFDLDVRELTDTACLICDRISTSCTPNSLRSILPATCVLLNLSHACICQLNQAAAYLSFNNLDPMGYGPDGWMMMNMSICGLFTAGCMCLKQAIFAVRPVSDGVYAVTCNIICPGYADAGGVQANVQIPFLANIAYNCCVGCLCHTKAENTAVWDQGDCIKRSLYNFFCASTSSPSCSFIKSKILCWQVNATSHLNLIGHVAYPANGTFECCSFDYCAGTNWNSHCYTSIAFSTDSDFGSILGNCQVNHRRYKLMVPICYQNGCYAIGSEHKHMIFGSECIRNQDTQRSGERTLVASPDCTQFSTGVLCSFAGFPIIRHCVDASAWNNTCSIVNQVAVTDRYYQGQCLQGGGGQPSRHGSATHGNRFRSNTYIISGDSSTILPQNCGYSASQFQCVGFMITAYQNPSSFCNNFSCFIGIAQNNANPGDTVCVAVPGLGMRDKTKFANILAAVGSTCCTAQIGVCTSTIPAFRNSYIGITGSLFPFCIPTVLSTGITGTGWFQTPGFKYVAPVCTFCCCGGICDNKFFSRLVKDPALGNVSYLGPN